MIRKRDIIRPKGLFMTMGRFLPLAFVLASIFLITSSTFAQDECTGCDPRYSVYADAHLVGEVKNARNATKEEKEGIIDEEISGQQIKVVRFLLKEAIDESVKEGSSFELLAKAVTAKKLKIGKVYLVYVENWGGKSFSPLGIDGRQTKLVTQATEALKYIRKCKSKQETEETGEDFKKAFKFIGRNAISLPKPKYSDEARKEKASGTVQVQILLGEDGRVIKARVNCGHPLLVPAAIEAAKGARYSPTLLSGKPVKVTRVIVYNFLPQ